LRDPIRLAVLVQYRDLPRRLAVGETDRQTDRRTDTNTTTAYNAVA